MCGSRGSVLRSVAFFPLLAISLLSARQVQAQDGIVVVNASMSVDYGRTITFQAHISAPLPIKQASILFRSINEDVTRVENIQIAKDGSTSFTYDTSLNVFPPFSLIVFWFQATLADDQTYTSSPITFAYNDNRFTWRETIQGNVVVHWYAGDEAFGAAGLNAAATGMTAINEIIPASLDDPVNVYIYSNVEDLKGALEMGGLEWARGHANPDLGVVLVAIAPGTGQFIEMETKIPHELAHLAMYRALSHGYARQPAWLLEGFASTMELHPNPDYAQALQIASRNDSLLSFEELCASFPADAGNAFLAYAQSQSFVSYIRSTYGGSGLGRLTDSYADGFSCELGVTNALGTSLGQLEGRWRETALGQNVVGVAARNLSPFLLLMALVLIVPLWGTIDMLRQRRKHAQRSK